MRIQNIIVAYTYTYEEDVIEGATEHSGVYEFDEKLLSPYHQRWYTLLGKANRLTCIPNGVRLKQMSDQEVAEKLL